MREKRWKFLAMKMHHLVPRQVRSSYAIGTTILGAIAIPIVAYAATPQQPTTSAYPEAVQVADALDLDVPTGSDTTAATVATKSQLVDVALVSSVAALEAMDNTAVAATNLTTVPTPPQPVALTTAPSIAPSTEQTPTTRYEVGQFHLQRGGAIVTPSSTAGNNSPSNLPVAQRSSKESSGVQSPQGVLIADALAQSVARSVARSVAQTSHRPATQSTPARPTEVTVLPPSTTNNPLSKNTRNTLPSGENTVPPAKPDPMPLSDTFPKLLSSSAATDSAATYVVNPRLGIRYNSANTGHEYGYFGFEGFAPLAQVPGHSVTFVEGRVLVQQNAAIGTNLLLGQRFYSPEGDRSYGGYISYDTRNTGRSFFSQLGLGLETLGDVDARLNVYIPLGITRNRVADGFTGAFTIVPSGTGVGVNLALDRFQGFEAAATVVDLETGGKILPLGERGVLRAYGGLYYLSASGSPSVVGVKGRLEALPADFLNLGASLQYDSLFQTRAAITVGITFPGSAYDNSPNRDTLPKLRGIDRLGESIARQNAIHVLDPTIAGQQQIGRVFATSTVTGNPLRILLVNQTGGGGGNGTETTPFTDTATAAANATTGDFVFALANAGAPASAGFTIPDQVTVLSTQSQIPINAVEISNIQLNPPFTRGAGILVPISGTVTMGNSTVLSGFEVTATPGNSAIQAANVGNVLIQDNTIASNGGFGVALTTVNAASVVNNQITSNGAAGIRAQEPSNLLLQGNTVTATNANGIRVTNVTGNAVISGNTATATGVLTAGILVENNAGVANLTIADNTATGGNNGIDVRLQGTAQTGATGINITGNRAINSVSAGIFVQVDSPNATPERVVTIANNIVQGNSTGPSFAPGIQVEAINNARLRAFITNNDVTGNADGGIGLFTSGAAAETATLFSQVRLNTLTGNGALIGDLSANIFPGANNTRICLQANGNTIGTFRRQNNALAPAVIQVEPGTNTIGTTFTSPTGVVDPVASGTCGF